MITRQAQAQNTRPIDETLKLIPHEDQVYIRGLIDGALLHTANKAKVKDKAKKCG